MPTPASTPERTILALFSSSAIWAFDFRIGVHLCFLGSRVELAIYTAALLEPTTSLPKDSFRPVADAQA